MKQTERFIPEGYELAIDHKDLGITVYYKDLPNQIGKPVVCALCFVGKAVKPTWQYRFKDVEQRTKEVEQTFAKVQAKLDRKTQEKAKKSEAMSNHGVVASDVFRCSWGYDQTNIDYYEVIAVTGKTATVCRIGCLSQEDGFLQGESVPSLGAFIGKPFKKLIQKRSVDSEAFLTMNSFSTAFKMIPVATVANKPIYESSRWTAYA
jgi:hypothetical protein